MQIPTKKGVMLQMGVPIKQSEGSPSNTEELTSEIHYYEIYEYINTNVVSV